MVVPFDGPNNCFTRVSRPDAAGLGLPVGESVLLRAAGSPRAVARPGFPQIRICAAYCPLCHTASIPSIPPGNRWNRESRHSITNHERITLPRGGGALVPVPRLEPARSFRNRCCSRRSAQTAHDRAAQPPRTNPATECPVPQLVCGHRQLASQVRKPPLVATELRCRNAIPSQLATRQQFSDRCARVALARPGRAIPFRVELRRDLLDGLTLLTHLNNSINQLIVTAQ